MTRLSSWWVRGVGAACLVVLAACSGSAGSDDADTDSDTLVQGDTTEDDCEFLCQSRLTVWVDNADYDLDGDFELEIEGEFFDISVACPGNELLRNPPGMTIECFPAGGDTGEPGIDDPKKQKKGNELRWGFELRNNDWEFPETLVFSDIVFTWDVEPVWTPREVCGTSCNVAEVTTRHPFGQ